MQDSETCTLPLRIVSGIFVVLFCLDSTELAEVWQNYILRDDRLWLKPKFIARSVYTARKCWFCQALRDAKSWIMSLGIIIPLLIVCGFFAGSIPMGYLLGRLRGVDLREIGSGNIGATNARRALGNRFGVYTLLLDILKGSFAASLPTMAKYWGFSAEIYDIAAITGYAAILGHCFSPFMKMKGGKGVATSLGVFGLLAPIQTGIAVAVFIVVVAFSRFVSLASIVAAMSLLVLAFLQFPTPVDSLLVLVIFFSTVIIVGKHKDNIQRLRQGVEPKLGT